MIKQIEIENFKSIIADKVIFPSFAVIIGRNAAGKTNLLQAINLIKRLVRGDSVNDVQKKICLSLDEIFNLNEASNEAYFKIIIKVNSEKEYSFSFRIKLKERNGNVPKLIISQEKLEKIIINPDNNKSCEVIYKRELDELKNNADKNIPLAVDLDKLAISVYKENEVVEVKKFFSNVAVIDQQMMDLKESFTNSGKKNTLPGLLLRLIKDQDDKESFMVFKEVVNKILPDFVDFDQLSVKDPPDGEEIFLFLLREENLKERLSLESISDGDLRSLYIIAKAMNMKKGSSLFIEEIENGMHPKRLSDLIKNLEALSVRREFQIIFTTHSPELINSFKPSDILFAKKDRELGTKFILIEKHKDIGPIQKYLAKGGKLTDYINSRFR